ncbi:hypothetical protein J4422_01895 [Candidatus Pacearchaeota archaeon]|nr:hypothetical protein [Candidatus Pacearchaeota archaeon]
MDVTARINDVYGEIAKINGKSRKTHVFDHNGYPIYAFQYGRNPEVFVSSGMHCDEWTEIYAHLFFLHNLGTRRNFPPFVSIPFINPVGLTKYPKRDRSNRRWGGKAKTEGILQRTIRNYLSRFNFQDSLDMHEDTDMRRAYVYERFRNGKASLARKILDSLHYPVLKAEEIYKEECVEGVVPSNHIEENTLESMMFHDFETNHSLTSEVPGKLSREHRVKCGTQILTLFMKHLH